LNGYNGELGVSQQILTDSARDKLNLDIFWLKDESLEDSANLAGLSSLPGFPRHTRSLGASRRKVAAAFLRAANANPDIIATEIVLRLLASAPAREPSQKRKTV
jgi:hypothetical protein